MMRAAVKLMGTVHGRKVINRNKKTADGRCEEWTRKFLEGSHLCRSDVHHENYSLENAIEIRKYSKWLYTMYKTEKIVEYSWKKLTEWSESNALQEVMKVSPEKKIDEWQMKKLLNDTGLL